MYSYVVHLHIQYRGSMLQQGFHVEIFSSNTPPRELYRIILSESNDKTWWWPLPAETCSFLSKNITSNQIYTAVLLTTYPLITSYAHNGDDTLQTPWRFFLILSSHLRCLPNGLFQSGIPIKTLYVHLLSPIRATCLAHYIFCFIIIIIIIYLSWIWVTCWPVPVSRIQKSLQKSTVIPSASWGVVFHYPGYKG